MQQSQGFSLYDSGNPPSATDGMGTGSVTGSPRGRSAVAGADAPWSAKAGNRPRPSQFRAGALGEGAALVTGEEVGNGRVVSARDSTGGW